MFLAEMCVKKKETSAQKREGRKRRTTSEGAFQWVMQVQYADFEEAQEEAIPCHSRRGLTRESIMTHS
jgi:hypothetical protein